jgi:hypothetical protein
MDSVPLHSTMIIPGVTYEWNAAAFDPVNPTAAISGFSSPGSGDTIPGENIVSTLLTQGVIKYNVTATFTSNGVGCPGDTEIYSVFVNPAPTVSFSPVGDQTICSGSTSNRIDLFTNTPPTTFSWQIVEIAGVAGAIPNGTTDFIPPQVLTTTGSVQGHVKYGLTPIYQGGGSFSCSGGVTYFTIFVDPLPLPVVSGTNSLCELSTDITYQTLLIAGNSYSWIVTGANNVINGNTHEITVNWGPSTASPGTLAVVETIDATGCTDTSAVMHVILHDRPNPLLNGSSQVCMGSSGMMYTTDQGMSNYLWNITGGEITNGGNGFRSATVTWNGQGSQYIEVNYQNQQGCSALTPTRLPVMVNALPITTISEGPGPNCEGALHSYMVPDDPLCTYVWSVTPSSRGTITGIQNKVLEVIQKGSYFSDSM